MDTCPTEILSYIFQLACTDDDGYIYRSLSRVSNYFRDVTRPLQYNSLAISGVNQAVEISARLASIDVPPHMRRVRHLFISDSDHTKSIDHHGKASIIRILALAAPTLQSLTFHASSPASSTSLIAGLFNIVFPKLIDLTVIGFYPFPHIPDSMPILRRLHLRGNRNPHGLLHMGNLRVACPNLTHLRISGLSMAISFVEELADALRNHDEETQTLFSPRLPPKIRTLAFQPASVPEMSFQFRMCDAKDKVMMKRLSELSHRDSAAGTIKVILCERDIRHQSPFSTYESARHEWTHRLNETEFAVEDSPCSGIGCRLAVSE